MRKRFCFLALALTSFAGAQTFPTTIMTGKGPVAIPKKPLRIVSLSMADTDTLLALGLTPLSATAGGSPNTLLPWEKSLQGKVQIFPAFGDLSLETVAALKPDLILASNRYGADQLYDQLSKIAPTVLYKAGDSTVGWGKDTWQERVAYIAQATGRVAEGQALIRRLESQIRTFAQGSPAIRRKTFTYNYGYGGSGVAITTVVSPDTGAARFFGALGMKLPTQLTTAKAAGNGQANVSLETLQLINADLLLIGYSDDAVQKTIEGNPLFKKLSAVQNGRVAVIGQDGLAAYQSPTPLNIPWMLENLRGHLQKLK